MKTCATCKYFNTEYEQSLTKYGYGECEAVPESYAISPRSDNNPLAVVLEADESNTAFRVKPNFGCIMHEEKHAP